jgi:hypothetical protein
MPAFGPQEPKPYDFVPLPPRVDRTEPAGHGWFSPSLFSGTITGELVAQSPVHVGSGGIELTGDSRLPLVKAHFRTAGKAGIPGSSLKGIVRSVVEAITCSCVRVTSRRSRELLPREFQPCELSKDRPQLCLACRLFGAMDYQGQVRCADAVMSQGRLGTVLSPSLYAPRPDASLYRKAVGRKFYFHGELARGNVPLEVCDVGSRFRFRADFVNLSEAELGVLLFALGQGEPRFNLKLGGAKPACCGSIQAILKSINLHSAHQVALEFDATSIVGNAARYLHAGATKIDRASLEALGKIWRVDPSRTCPSLSY